MHGCSEAAEYGGDSASQGQMSVQSSGTETLTKKKAIECGGKDQRHVQGASIGAGLEERTIE